MSPHHEFEQQLAHAWPPSRWWDVTVMLAVSGGSDSVALLRAMAALGSGGRLVVAHYNHRLRGPESDADEAFVRSLSEELHLECHVGRSDASSASSGDGVEAAARRRRYRFLRQAADRAGARYVATAHTADDQAETILHRIVRGTGLAGLAGIPRTRPLSPLTTIIRPLLKLPRAAIRQYLQDLHQPFRADSTNDLLHFTRNRIRHQLMPALAHEYNPKIVEALLRLGELAGEAHDVIGAMVDALLEQSVSTLSATHMRIDCSLLREQPAYLVRELLVAVWKRQHWPQQDMGHGKWQQLCELIQRETAPPRSMTFPGVIRAEVRGDTLDLNHTPATEA